MGAQAILAQEPRTTLDIDVDEKQAIQVQKQFVIARGSFTAKKPTQLSFGKGDTIEVVKAMGKWHQGILHKSSKHPITKKVLLYPSNFCKPLSAAEGAVISNSSQRAVSVWLQPKEAVKSVKTTSVFVAKKRTQMSFGKGDVIEVISEEGKWHLGILRQSNTCELTGEKLFYPSNYVVSL